MMKDIVRFSVEKAEERFLDHVDIEVLLASDEQRNQSLRGDQSPTDEKQPPAN